jgi:hypothetical protein
MVSDRTAAVVNDREKLLRAEVEIDARHIQGRALPRVRAENEYLTIAAADAYRTISSRAVEECGEALPGL